MASVTRRELIGLLVLVMATLLAYLPVFNNGFVWDDDLWLTENQAVHSPGDLGAIWQLKYDHDTGEFQSPTTQYYPLVFTSFWIENKIWGLDPLGYHAINLVLHLFNVLLVWVIARRIGLGSGLLIAAIFALHPVHVESVAWVTQRRNLLSGLFYLLAMWSYLGFDHRRQWWRWVLALGLFVGALLSKTVTATLPFALLLLLVFVHGKGSHLPRLKVNQLWPLLPLVLVGMVAGLVAANLETGSAGANTLVMDTSIVERIFILVPSTFAFYAGKILWPFPVSFIYPRWVVDAGNPLQYIPLLGLVAAMAAAFWGWRRLGQIGPMLLILFSGLTLAPALGLFDVYFFRYSYVADHWQYLGSLGFIILLVVLVEKLVRRFFSKPNYRKISVVISVVVLGVLGATSFQQTLAYKDAETLWRHTLKTNPTAWIALNNLGRIEAEMAFQAQDQRLRFEWLNKSKSHFEQAMKFDEARPEACNNLANIAYLQKDYNKAAQMYLEAISLQPDEPGVYYNLRMALSATGDVAQAAAIFDRVLKEKLVHEDLTRAEVYHQLGRAQAELGANDKAAASIQQALATYPSLPNVQLFQVSVLVKLERYREAMAGLRRVPRGHGEYLGAKATLVRLLATCPDSSLRDCREAKALLLEIEGETKSRGLPPAIVELHSIVNRICGP